MKLVSSLHQVRLSLGLCPLLYTDRKRDGLMASVGERLLALALPSLGVLDVLLTTIVYLRQGELLTERNPIVKIITGSQNFILYYIWSVGYILFLTFFSRWLVSESYRAKRGEETPYGRLLKRVVHDPRIKAVKDNPPSF